MSIILHKPKPKKRRRKTSYGASPIKRPRRTKSEITTIVDALVPMIEEEKPMTVRQVFYRAVGLGLIPKTEAAYKTTICRLLVDLRRKGTIPFDWIADNTRWMRKPKSYSSKEAMLKITAQTYRRALWDDQDVYCEIWLEKEALAGVVFDKTWDWDVPLMVTRGYPSLSYVHAAAEAIAAQDKPAYLYYFGDHDPSGVDIPRMVERGVRELAPDSEIHFERVAVLPEHIQQFDLPTRPTKTTDSRAKNFEGESVELDAIPPSTLREMVEICILHHIDRDALERTRAVEKAERETLLAYCGLADGEDSQ
jgi:hypothetical protein